MLVGGEAIAYPSIAMLFHAGAHVEIAPRTRGEKHCFVMKFEYRALAYSRGSVLSRVTQLDSRALEQSRANIRLSGGCGSSPLV